jgi:hypothetical protein
MHTNIETSSQAAEALRPLAGACAELIFALGIIGTGLLAIPVLAGLGRLCNRRRPEMAGRSFAQAGSRCCLLCRARVIRRDRRQPSHEWRADKSLRRVGGYDERYREIGC